MFSEGSLFWFFTLILKYNVFYLICVMTTIGVAYIFQRFLPSLSAPERQFRLNKLCYAIVASQLTILLISALYITHQLHWTLIPNLAYAIKFLNTKYHFVLLAMGPDIGFLLSIFIIKATLPLKWSDFGLRKPAVKIWVVVIGLILAGLILLIIASYVWAYFSGLPYKDLQIVVDAVKSLKLHWAIMFIVVVVIILPIIEEIFFRGVIFSALTEVSGVKIGLILQAILWAVIHNDVSALPLRFVSGLVLAYVYYRSKSLLPSIVIHSLLNIFTFGVKMV